jgi:hypothetical protein
VTQNTLVKPQSLVTWLRVRAANVLSQTGADWGGFLGRNFSGTYPNQYVVTDFNMFTSGQPLRPGTLTVVEEIPSMVVSGDVTPQLERGYWPSCECVDSILTRPIYLRGSDHRCLHVQMSARLNQLSVGCPSLYLPTRQPLFFVSYRVDCLRLAPSC